MTTRHLRLALDASSALPQLVAVAFELAEHLGTRLEGLFIEDLDLLRSAEIERVLKVSLLTAGEERFDLASTERELRVLADLARQSLEESAQRRHVEWTFRILRARRQEVVEQAAPMLLLQGQRVALARGSDWSCAPAIVTGAEGPHAETLELAARLAAPAGGLEALVVGASREASERVFQQLRGFVAPSLAVRVRRVDELDLVPALRELNGRLLILEGSSPVLRRVVRAVEGPVVVVGSPAGT